MDSILECHGLTKSYGKMYNALNNLNLFLERGQIVGLLGPNGSGKTTLIKLINGLLVPTAGEVLIKSMAPGVETKKIVSYLPERTYLNESMQITEVLDYFSDFYENFSRERAGLMLSEIGRASCRERVF